MTKVPGRKYLPPSIPPHRAGLAALLVALAAQLTIAYYNYEIDGHRLAGFDFLNYFYPQAVRIIHDVGLVSASVMQQKLSALTAFPNYYIETTIPFPDAAYLALLPFALAGPKVALVLFLISSLLLASAGVYLLAKNFPPSQRLVITALGTMSAGVHYNLLHGHTGGIYFLVAAGAVILAQSLPVVSALLLGILFAHKFYFIGIAPLIFIWGKRKAAIYSILFAALISLLDSQSMLSVETALRPFNHYSSHASISTQTIFTLQAGSHELIYRLFHGAPQAPPLVNLGRSYIGVYALFTILVFGFTAMALLKINHDAENNYRAFAAIFSCVGFTLPSMGNYNLIFLLIPLTLSFQVSRLYLVSAVLLLIRLDFLRYPDLFGGYLPPVPNPEWIGMLGLWIVSLSDLSRISNPEFDKQEAEPV